MIVMQVLVLNNDFTPMNVTDIIRGFNLVFKGKAEIIEHDEDNPIVEGDNVFKRPSVIRLLKYVVLPYKRIKATRDNIFKRDGHKCIYCDYNKDLTIDHVYPRSRGGDNSWENLATCCTRCNSNKGDRTIEEAGMTLITKPFRPGYSYFIKKMAKAKRDWANYIPE